MTWFLKKRVEEETTPLEGNLPSSGQQFIAGAKLAYQKTDAWFRKSRLENEILDPMIERLGGPEAIVPRTPEEWRRYLNKETRPDYVLDRAQDLMRMSPEDWGDLPRDRNQFDALRNQRDLAEEEETQALLARGDSPFAQFAGSMAGYMTDETSLPFLFMGGSLAKGLGRFVLAEAALGAAGEVPAGLREGARAERLGQEAPDFANQVATGALFGGAFGAVLGGGAKALEYLAARQAGDLANRPPGAAGVDVDAETQAAERAYRAGADLSVTPPTAFSRVVEAGSGYTVVTDGQGRMLRREGTRAWRNNNPGNIEYGKFAQSMGAIGSDGRFAVFPTYADGRRAKEQLLWGTASYRNLTIRGAISRYAPSFENDTAAYARTVASAIGVSADTPMASLSGAQRKTMLDAMEKVEGFRAGKENGVQASHSAADYEPVTGGGRSGGFAGGGVDGGATGRRRGPTEFYEVTTPAGRRVDVQYRVRDMGELLAAEGDLQPRDRSRAASDEQIAKIAAQLDASRLMPGPESDRGAPVIGPDRVVESGNGRVAALRLASETNPDGYAQYVQAIRDAGYDIPEGVKRPVLVAERTSEMTPDERRAFIRESNTSAIARMSATEQARFDGAGMTQAQFDAFQPGRRIGGAENAEFIRRMFAGMTAEERAPLMTRDGALSVEGLRRVRAALFARAFEADDLLQLATETENRSVMNLIRMLEDLAPDWAFFRSLVDAGMVRPEFDITAQLMDAIRIIAKARVENREGQSVIGAIRDRLDQGDMFAERDILTEALIEVFYKGDRARNPDLSGDILQRYAAEAANVGRADMDDLADAVSPVQVLDRAIAAAEGGTPFAPLPPRMQPEAAPLDVAGFDAAPFADGTAGRQLDQFNRAREDALLGEADEVAPVQGQARSAQEETADRLLNRGLTAGKLREMELKLGQDGDNVQILRGDEIARNLQAWSQLEDIAETCRIVRGGRE